MGSTRSPRLEGAGAEVAGVSRDTAVSGRELARAAPSLLPLGNKLLPARTKHERLLVKQNIEHELVSYTESLRSARSSRTARWVERTHESPFQVDQAASAERTNLLRSEREYQRERARARAQNEDKTALRDFLLRASEPNRLEELRKEKRNLLQQHRQLLAEKALERKTERTLKWEMEREIRCALREGRHVRPPEVREPEFVFK